MQTNEPLSEMDKLRAFELRMQTEGAAGFANGPEPWSHWEEPAETDSKRAWGCDREREDIPPGKTLCERILTTMATLAVATLAVGIGGVYLSAQSVPPLAQQDTPPGETVAAAEPVAIPGDSSATTDTTRTTLAIEDETSLAMSQLPVSPATEAMVEPAQQAPVSADVSLATGDSTLTPVQSIADITQLPELSTKITLADMTAALPAPAAGRASTEATATAKATASNALAGDAAPAEATASDSPTTVSMAASPVASAPRPARAAAEETATGPWVVNIASYTYESMARRKLKEFRDQGVVAEIFPVTIKGKPMYRIRATGYESRKEAKTWLSLLEDRLGVDSAWVSKR